MLNTPPPQPVQPNYGGYTQYPQYGGGYSPYQQQPYYGGQYPQQGYQNYMGQPNPYMNNSYQPNYQPGAYGGYMNQSTTGYMNQSYQPPQQNNQPYNPYNTYKKWSLNEKNVKWENIFILAVSMLNLFFCMFRLFYLSFLFILKNYHFHCNKT